jgi:SAM-dependent methyltransferase
MISDGAHFELADYEGESANPASENWIKELASNPNGAYLDLGCGLRDIVFDNCLYVEVYPSVSADIVMTPNARLPIADESLDGLYCAAVLEHLENPFFTAAEIKRVVKTGGHIYIDWPFLQPVHGYPSHFYNATRMGLKRLFEDTFEIEQLSTVQSQSATYTLHWILNWFILGLTDDLVRERMCNMTVGELAACPPEDAFYQKALEFMSQEMQMKLACGNTLIGRKVRPPF